MSSWELGQGVTVPTIGSNYPYNSGNELSSVSHLDPQHNTTRIPPPFRGDSMPMPISPHLPPHLQHHLESANNIHQPPFVHGGSVGHYGHGHHLATPPLSGTESLHHCIPLTIQQYQLVPPGLTTQVPGGAGEIHHQSTGNQHHHQHVDPYNVGLRLPTAAPITSPTIPGVSMVPQTPQGAPRAHPFGPSGSTPEKGPELSPQLMEQGWTKCWSKREGRYYFFNCNTNESIWELPAPGRHGHHYDPITDPLGIQHGGVHVGIKRRASSGEYMGSPPPKRIIVSGPWDLEVASNVYTSEPQTPRHDLLPPHPTIEQLRYQLLAKLRLCYQQACKSREQIEAPKESLNRWLMEQKIKDTKTDPLFPYCENPEGVISMTIFKEIINDVPMKVVKPRFTGDARKQLAKFAEACKKTIETRSASSDHRKLVKWKAEETFTWLRETVGAPYDAFQERLAHLKETIQPLVHEAAKSSVEGICKKISVLSRQYSVQVREAHLALFSYTPDVKRPAAMEIGRYKSLAEICGDYQFKEDALPQPNKPLVDYLQQDKDNVLIKHKNEPVRISVNYLHKLDALYKYHVLDDKKQELFLTRVYCLLKRYNAFCNEYTICQTSQGSIPTPVFESIQRNFGVTFECFSSPFNCYFRNYCSAFPDVDGFFGSSGNFLEFQPISGSFEMNPPLCDDLIEAAITHTESLLGSTQEPMSFIIFVPEFDDSKDSDKASHEDSVWINRLQNSGWKRKQVTIPAFEHDYRSGAQHIVPKNEIAIRSSHATVVFWLQNDAGFESWEPTEERVDALIDSYRPGRERERDRSDLLAPERQNPHQADKALAAAKAVSSDQSISSASGIQPAPALPTNA